jgi:alpha-beta hydrolase superfamily lysophospholipase
MPPTSPLLLEHREHAFAGAGGLSLYYQAWVPPTVGHRAALINIHGLGDHSGLYPHLAEHFPARGIPIYAFDLRGNGRSPGQRAYVGSWDEYRGDLAAFVRLVRLSEPGAPLFLLGNSLAG